MKHENVSALLASGKAQPVAATLLTEEQRFDAVIEAFQALKDRQFRLFRGLEHIKDESVLRGLKIDAQDLFGVMAKAIGLKTHRLGDLMDAMALSPAEVHLFGCACHRPNEEPMLDGELIALMIHARKAVRFPAQK